MSGIVDLHPAAVSVLTSAAAGCPEGTLRPVVAPAAVLKDGDRIKAARRATRTAGSAAPGTLAGTSVPADQHRTPVGPRRVRIVRAAETSHGHHGQSSPMAPVILRLMRDRSPSVEVRHRPGTQAIHRTLYAESVDDRACCTAIFLLRVSFEALSKPFRSPFGALSAYVIR